MGNMIITLLFTALAQGFQGTISWTVFNHNQPFNLFMKMFEDQVTSISDERHQKCHNDTKEGAMCVN